MNVSSNYILKGVTLMSVKSMLNEELETELEELKKIEIGGDDYKAAVDGITKLADRMIELEKLNNEAEERNKNREVDAELKQAQLEATKKDNRVKNAISIAGILVPIGVTIWGTLKAFEFEKDGTVTTLIGKGFINKLIHK